MQHRDRLFFAFGAMKRKLNVMFNRVRSSSLPSDDFSLLLPEFDVELLPREIRELYDSWTQSEEAEALSSGTVAESDWPVAIFVPERYEEHYAYPLIIWFHSDDTDEDQLEDVMSAVSQQNYCGLALRANHFHDASGGYRWDTSAVQFGTVPLRDLLHVTACRLRRAFHIHSERIFLAGSGSGADAALQTFAHRPEWFAGAILLDPLGRPENLQSERLTGLRGKPILQTVSRQMPDTQLAANVESVRLLRSAGANVRIELTDGPTDPTGSEVRFIDHWIMESLNKTALV